MGAQAGALRGGGAHVKHFIWEEARRFPVIVQRSTGGEELQESIILTKAELQAAQLVGESSKELIQRFFFRRGFCVVDIGKPEKRTLTVDLEALWKGEG